MFQQNWHFQPGSGSGSGSGPKSRIRIRIRSKIDRIRNTAQLTAFVDSCFTENGRRWTLRRPFLTISDLTNEWNVFTSTKSGRYDNGGRTRDGSDRRKRGNTPPARRAKFPAPSDGDACWRFNEGICQNNNNNCKTRTGVRLRHICSARTGTNGDPCGKRHPAKYHS